jgi:hypothetical protein
MSILNPPFDPAFSDITNSPYSLAFDQYFNEGMLNEAASLAEVRLRRVFPVLLFVHRDTDDVESLAKDMAEDMVKALNKEGCDLVFTASRVHGSSECRAGFARQREPATRADHEQCQNRVWSNLQATIKSKAREALMIFVIGSKAFLPADQTAATPPPNATIQQTDVTERSRWRGVEVDLAEAQKLLEHAIKITELVGRLLKLLRGRKGAESAIKRLEKVEQRLQELETTRDLAKHKDTIISLVSEAIKKAQFKFNADGGDITGPEYDLVRAELSRLIERTK